jgi:hypothetical protein
MEDLLYQKMSRSHVIPDNIQSKSTSTPLCLQKERERKKECHALQLPPIKSNLVHALTSISRWAEAKSLSRSLFLTSLIIKGGRGKGGGGMEGSYHVTTTI